MTVINLFLSVTSSEKEAQEWQKKYRIAVTSNENEIQEYQKKYRIAVTELCKIKRSLQSASQNSGLVVFLTVSRNSFRFPFDRIHNVLLLEKQTLYRRTKSYQFSVEPRNKSVFLKSVFFHLISLIFTLDCFICFIIASRSFLFF